MGFNASYLADGDDAGVGSSVIRLSLAGDGRRAPDARDSRLQRLGAYVHEADRLRGSRFVHAPLRRRRVDLRCRRHPRSRRRTGHRRRARCRREPDSVDDVIAIGVEEGKVASQRLSRESEEVGPRRASSRSTGIGVAPASSKATGPPARGGRLRRRRCTARIRTRGVRRALRAVAILAATDCSRATESATSEQRLLGTSKPPRPSPSRLRRLLLAGRRRRATRLPVRGSASRTAGQYQARRVATAVFWSNTRRRDQRRRSRTDLTRLSSSSRTASPRIGGEVESRDARGHQASSPCSS